MGESLCIDSPLRGLGMPKACSDELRETRNQGEDGRIAARGCRTFRRECEFGGQVVAALARQWESRCEAARRRRFSAGKVAAQILTLIAEEPDRTLVETVAVLRRERIRTSLSSLWRFLNRHNITLKKSLQAAERQRADVARARRRWIRERHA
jgi:hypothetical protein